MINIGKLALPLFLFLRLFVIFIKCLCCYWWGMSRFGCLMILWFSHTAMV